MHEEKDVERLLHTSIRTSSQTQEAAQHILCYRSTSNPLCSEAVPGIFCCCEGNLSFLLRLETLKAYLGSL